MNEKLKLINVLSGRIKQKPCLSFQVIKNCLNINFLRFTIVTVAGIVPYWEIFLLAGIFG